MGYLTGSRSTFPEMNDSLLEMSDLTVSEKVSALRWQTLKLQASLTPTEQTEFNNLTTQLAPKIFSAEIWNLLGDAIIQMENFIDSTFQNYYKYIGIYSDIVTYNIYNTCKYDGEIYMALQTTIGNLPTNQTYFLKIGGKGDSGQKGDPGVNLVPRGSYNNSYTYSVNDLVIYNNIVYYCILTSIGNLPTNETYWTLFLEPPSTVDGKTANGTLNTTEQTNLTIAINEVLSNINNLAGSERTTETVKTNADNIIKIMGVKTATITSTWVGSTAPYTQDITITGVTSNDEPIISPIYDADNATAILQKTAWNCVGKIITGTDKITVTCFEEKPITAIPIQLKGV